MLLNRTMCCRSMYVARKTEPKLDLLQNALRQNGPWKGQEIPAERHWVHDQIMAKILSIDWDAARQDVQRFLPLGEQKGLRFWDKDFFLHQLERMFSGSTAQRFNG